MARVDGQQGECGGKSGVSEIRHVMKQEPEQLSTEKGNGAVREEFGGPPGSRLAALQGWFCE